MRTVHLLQLSGICALFAALYAPSAALAQYAWIDERGVKQFSDMPPPPSVPAGRILKQPASSSRPGIDAQPSGGEAAGTGAATAPKTIAEQNAEFKKRRAEQAEKEKKAADEAKLAAEKNRSCERARNYQRLLESGQRIAHTDKNGERAILTDEQRTQELREAKQILNDCK